MSRSVGAAYRDAGDIPLEGGGRMRPGRLFRFAGGLVSDAELEALAAAGVRTVIDLRDPDEGCERVAGWAEEHRVRYVNAPIVVGGYAGGRWDEMIDNIASGRGREIQLASYGELALDFGVQQAQALNALANGLPGAFCCTTGKDRTGVLTAYVQVLLGASEETAVAAYLAGGPGSGLLDEQLSQLFPRGGDPVVMQRVRDYMDLQASNLEHVFALVRARGGVEPFLLEHGMHRDTPAKLREALVMTVDE